MKKILTLMSVTIFMMALLAGCGGKQADVSATDIVGTWVRDNEEVNTVYTFDAEGNYSETSTTKTSPVITTTDEGTFSIDGDEIHIKSGAYGTDAGYKISVSGEVMTWNPGKNEIVYNKSK